MAATDADGLMMGTGAWAKRGAATDRHEGYARDLGRNVNRAVIKLIMDGLIPPTVKFSWGLDREYYNRKGKAMFRVRRLPDGRKVVLSPKPPYKPRYYIAAEQGRLHLRQPGWSFKWVPGDPALVEEAKVLFRKHYMDNVGMWSLCSDLNKRGVLSTMGRRWNTQALIKVLRNPLWIGLSTGFMWSVGRHCERTKDSPKMFPISRRPGYKKNKTRRKRMKPILKPTCQWVTFTQPKLTKVLDPDVAKVVRREWQARIDRGGTPSAKPSMASRKRKCMPDSSVYFLSGLLSVRPGVVAEDDTHSSRVMNGQNGGGPKPSNPRGKVARYYISRRYKHRPVVGRLPERVRAEVVEQEVLRNLRLVLEDFTVHVPTISKFIEEKRKELLGRNTDTKSLVAEKARLERWYKTTFSAAGARGQALLKDEASKTEKRLDQIDHLLLEAGAALPDVVEHDKDAIIASVRRQFSQLRSVVDGKSPQALHRLTGALCRRIEFDPATRVVDIQFGLPSWALSKRDKLVRKIVPEGTSATRDSLQDNFDNFVVLASYSCKQFRAGRRPCMTCSRSLKRAA